MSEYPILVERLTGDQALVVACSACDHEFKIGPEDIRNDENYGCSKCGAVATYKYEEADKCPNCRKLGHWLPIDQYGTCSRACSLQWEYALSLGRVA